MIKKTLYPKTERVKKINENICQITEKLDGSNLCIFKLNDTLHIAQRKNIFTINDLEETKNSTHKGLYGWLLENKNNLQEELIERKLYMWGIARYGKIKIYS